MKTLKRPENMGEVLEVYFEVVRPTGRQKKKVRHAVKAVCQALGFASPDLCLIQNFPSSDSQMKAIPRLIPSLENDAGFRSIASAALKVQKFCLEKGWIEPPECIGHDLNLPPLERTNKDRRWPAALRVSKRLAGYAVSKKRKVEDWDDPFLFQFYEIVISERDYLGRRDLRWFLEIVNAEIEAGRFPNINFPPLDSKRAPAYSLPLDQWPESFQDGISKIRNWLTGDLVEERGQRSRVRESTAKQALKTIEQLGGYVVNIRREPLEEHSWTTLFAYDLVYDYLLYTDPEARNRHKNGKILTGVYQQGMLDLYIRILDGPLGLSDLSEQLRNLRLRFLFASKRSGPPKELSPNSFFSVREDLD